MGAVAFCVCTTAAVAADTNPGAEFARRLRAAGRAEARFERAARDPVSGRELLSRGRLALELPDRALLRFDASGERLAVRGDGGEWLQPALRQMILLGSERAAGARLWWTVLMGEERGAIAIRREARRRFILRPAGAASAGADSARLILDRAGLPAELELEEGGGPSRYRFSAWVFRRPRGRPAFVLAAPAGYEVVRLP